MLAVRGLRLAPRIAPSAGVVVAARSLHSTRPTWLATPSDSSLSSSAPTAGHHHHAAAEQDYSNGPSALDKAAKLFFMTEIFRGMLSLCSGSWAPDRKTTVVSELELWTGKKKACGSSFSRSLNLPTLSCMLDSLLLFLSSVLVQCRLRRDGLEGIRSSGGHCRPASEGSTR
jgi:hypothetical protein